jgi:hypothetical protein
MNKWRRSARRTCSQDAADVMIGNTLTSIGNLETSGPGRVLGSDFVDIQVVAASPRSW